MKRGRGEGVRLAILRLAAVWALAGAAPADAVEGFDLDCPGTAVEGGRIVCTLTNTGDAEAAWPVVGILHLGSDAARALVRGSPLDVQLAAPDPAADIEGGVVWIGPTLVGWSRFDWPGVAAAQSTRQVHIDVMDDDRYEGEETFYVALAPSGRRGPGALFLARQAVVVAESDTRSVDTWLQEVAFATSNGVRPEWSFAPAADTQSRMSVAYRDVGVTVTATPGDARASLAVNGVDVPGGRESPLLPLAAGAVTPVSVTVTAEDGTAKTYRFEVLRAARPDAVVVRQDGFELTCPSTVQPGAALACTLVNVGRSTGAWPVAAILHSSDDGAERALVAGDPLLPAASDSFAVVATIGDAQQPARENYHYGYGELFSGGSRSLRVTYGYQSFDWTGDASPGGSRSVTIETGAIGARPRAVFHVALAASGDSGLGRLVRNRAPVVVTSPSREATGAPSVSGIARVGEVLTAGPGTIADEDGLSRAAAGEAGFAFAWQWARTADGAAADIDGATAATYVIGADDVGAALRVRAEFRDDDGNAERRASAATAPVQPRAPVSVGQVTGVTVVGAVESLVVGWEEVDHAEGYRVAWRSGALAYGGDREAAVAATTYVIRDLEAGTAYGVRVVATADGVDGLPSEEAGGTPLASDDATLAALALSDVALAFDPAVERYAASVAHGVAATTVAATTSHDDATVALTPGDADGSAEGHQVALAEGATTTVRATVTAADREARTTYEVAVVRAPSDDAALSALALSDVELGGFDAETTSYAADVAFSTETTTVAATAEHPDATVAVEPGDADPDAAGHQVALAEGATTMVRVTVTAADGRTRRTYAVAVTRSPSDDATLSALALSDVELGGFDAETTSYAADVAFSTETTTVAAPAEHPDATVAVEPGDADPVAAGHQVALADGATTIVRATVTAPDGRTRRTYEVAVTRAPSDDAALGTLDLSDVEIAFDAGTTAYAAEVPFSIERTTVAATTRHPGAEVALAPADADGATSGHQVALEAGASTAVRVTVTAADGVTTRRYAVDVSRLATPSNDATLSALTLSDVDIGVFERGTTSYVGTARTGTTSTMVKALPTHSHATVVIEDAIGRTAGTGRRSWLKVGENEIAVTVTAEDGTSTRRYVVRVTHGGVVRLREREIELGDAVAEPMALWSDGSTLWVAGRLDRVYAYRLADGTRQPERDQEVASTAAPNGLWSDGETLWVADYYGGVQAYGLADGTRLSERDVAAPEAGSPTGLWSDGETLWVLDNVTRTAYAYGLADGARLADSDFRLAMESGWPMGLWSDGDTVVSSWMNRGAVLAFALDGGGSRADYRVETGTSGNDAPTGVWSDGGTLYVADEGDGRVYAYAWAGKPAGLSGRFEEIPERHGGAGTSFAALVAFSAPVVIGGGDFARSAAASNATVTGARDVDGGGELFEIDVAPDSDAPVTLAIAAERACEEAGAVCTTDGGRLARGIERTVAGPLSSDATLSSLSLTDVDFGTFDAAKTAYAADVAYSVDSTEVSAAANDVDAAVELDPADADGDAAGHQVALAPGVKTDVTATVTAADGETTATYTVAVRRAASDDAALASLALSNVDFGRFDPDTVTYVASVAYAVGRTTVSATARDAEATVAISPADADPNAAGHQVALAAGSTTAVAVTVTAADGEATETYAVAVTRASAADATLSSLSLSGVDFGVFDAATTDYAARVEHAVESTTVAATPTDPDATVSIGPTDADPNTAGHQVSLAAGSTTTVAVAVTAADGQATETYAVAVARASSADATLSSLSLSGVDFGVFDPSTTDYAASVGHAVESTTVTATATDAEATVSIAPADADAVAAGHQVSLAAESETRVAVTVTAADGGATETYAVAVTRPAAPSADATLSSLALTGVDIGRFDPETTEYAGEAPSGTRSTTVTALPADGSAAVSIEDARGSTLGTERRSLLVPGANAIAATVTAEDGATTRRYAVTVTRAGAARQPDRDIALGESGPVPTALWSDGTTLWVAGRFDGLYAYGLEDGARLPDRDLAVAETAAPNGLWSDGTTLWVADYFGGVQAYGLADGARLPERDVAAAAAVSPTGLWSDGGTLWVLDNATRVAYGYALSDGSRASERDFGLDVDAERMRPNGLWSDGERIYASSLNRGSVRAYALSDGARQPAYDVDTSASGNDAPTGLWSDGGTLWVADEADGRLYAYARASAPAGAGSRAHGVPSADAGPAVRFADGALAARVAAALGKAPDAAVGARELAALTALDARGAGIADLGGLEWAAGLERLDIGGGAVTDLGPLAGLGRLRSLNADGFAGDAWELARLSGLRRLSLRGAGLADAEPLAGLSGLEELDLRGNALTDVGALSGLSGLRAVRLAGNPLDDVGPLAGLPALRAATVGPDADAAALGDRVRVRVVPPRGGPDRAR